MKVPRKIFTDFIEDLKDKSPSIALRYQVHLNPVKKIEYICYKDHVGTFYIESEECYIWS